MDIISLNYNGLSIVDWHFFIYKDFNLDSKLGKKVPI